MMPLDVDEEEVKEEQESSSAATATLERRYGSLRPAAVGLLAKVRKKEKDITKKTEKKRSAACLLCFKS